MIGTALSGAAIVDAERICHELRKPITAVKAFAEILADGISGPLNDGQNEHVATILRNVELLDEQLGSLFEVSEAMHGRVALNLAACDMRVMCCGIHEELAPVFQEVGVRFHLEVGNSEEHHQVDAQRFRQALRRLLRDACRVSKRGGDVTLSLESTDGSIQICVNDTGTRIEPQISEALFEPFGSNAERLRGGFGIGPYLARVMVAAHGGEITVSSDERGTRFRIELPRSRLSERAS